ncbi:50S ribosomal protein L4 [Mycoplasmopsis columbinasalis]|uniref:Large ribosomal subunit protein uL4 n=1 Tax=Mycoplasmopsis columbinasalis TaxID=114880 RepID=A0A449BAJ2_9BACT|nr:50S ribosomal protein L4 [Mycoplasmopsis columbinasalis]VEU78046.1 50S ribosomal protein L4 [Mycoplasmopsis columbinasalis]
MAAEKKTAKTAVKKEKVVKAPSLEKYYIAEKFDKERNISFNFKKANQKTPENFKTFIAAVEHYIAIGEKSELPTRVWFHRDGAYRGSVSVDKARIIVKEVRTSKVEDTKAIEFIETKNLVEKPVPKPVKKEEPKPEPAVEEPVVEVKPAPAPKPAPKPKAEKVLDFNKETVLNFPTDQLPEELFGVTRDYSQAIFDTILSERAARRQGTHDVKSRAEVRGGGKKPWKQKGTGRARAGSTRSPIWVGGGRAFGPTPARNYTLKVNRKVKRAAFAAALSALARQKAVAVDEFVLNAPKTREAVAKLASLEVNQLKHILLVTTNPEVFQAVANLQNVRALLPQFVQVEDVVWADVLIISKEGIEVFKERGQR